MKALTVKQFKEASKNQTKLSFLYSSPNPLNKDVYELCIPDPIDENTFYVGDADTYINLEGMNDDDLVLFTEPDGDCIGVYEALAEDPVLCPHCSKILPEEVTQKEKTKRVQRMFDTVWENQLFLENWRDYLFEAYDVSEEDRNRCNALESPPWS